MSLQVWLPLTKDLKQQGLSNVIVTNNGATFNSAGKLGGCYSFNGSSYITVQDVVLQNIWSYSCWLYSDISSRGWEVVMACNINGGDADMQLGLYTHPGSNAIQNTANGQYNASIPMTYGQWNHFVGTFDGANLKTYLNGILVDTKVITNTKLDRPKLTIGARCRGSSYDCYFQGLLNDVRIYDHCLSEQEVKKLAQGLVLHYPLNRGGWGQENLLINSTNKMSSGYNVSNFSCSANNAVTEWGCTDAFRCTGSGGTSSIIGTLGNGQPSDSSLKYSYSVWVKNNHSTNKIAFSVNHGWQYSEWLDPGQAKRIFVEGASGNGTSYIQFNWRTKIEGDAFDFSYWHPKIEIGDKITPWCPNSSETLATSMELNGTTEYDCSGFSNNGTRINFAQPNLLFGSDFSSPYTTDLVTNSSTDWTKYLRGYNSSTDFTFSNEECTTTLVAAANLGPCFVRKATDINLDPNSYYTLSCEAKSTQTSRPLCIGLSYYKNSNTWEWRGGTNPTNFTATNTWQKFSLTFKPDADTQYICYCFTVVGVASGTDTFTIRHCKLEKGLSATPWTKEESNNWTSDTPKYHISTAFFGDRYITEPNEIYTTDSTIALWVKGPLTANAHVLDARNSSETGKQPIYQYTDGSIQTGGNNAYVTTSAGLLVANTWIHVALVQKDNSLLIYKNGLLFQTLSCSNSPIIKPTIGARLNFSNKYTGQLSDFRVYATALSAADVKLLYEGQYN